MVDKINNTLINNYANSMFRHEHLNTVWIDKCKQYLENIFDDLKGKVVVDYAFGRGNWTLAFLAAGAEKVYAIDASIDNCHRLTSYCKKNNIINIEVIHGNIIDTPIELEADLLWVYGVLHHIEEINLFLDRSKSLLNNCGQSYFYYYNKGSLRNIIVGICRQLFTLSDQEQFSSLQWLLPRAVKKRASDDLIAPYIDWKSLTELDQILIRNGYFPTRQADIDFDEFIHGRKNQEFYPHQLLCSQRQTTEQNLVEPENPFSKELTILQRFLTEVLLHPALFKNRQNLSLGLYNTHSINIDNGKIDKAILENFIYGLTALLDLTENETDSMSTEVNNYKALLLASIQDLPRTQFIEILGDNMFTQYLCNKCIRI